MSEFRRKLKFLRDRDQVTLTRLATALGLEKDYLRDVEAGRQEPSSQAIWLMAEFFKVKPDYFKTSDDKEAKAPPLEKPGASAGRGAAKGAPGKAPGSLDFGDFAFFKEQKAEGGAKAAAPAEFEGYAGEGSQVILKDGVGGDLSDSAPERPGSTRVKKPRPEEPPAPPPRPAPIAKPVAAPAPAPAPKAAPAKAAPHLPDPMIPLGKAPAAISRPVESDSAAVLVRALVDVFVKKGFFTREEFEAALERAAR